MGNKLCFKGNCGCCSFGCMDENDPQLGSKIEIKNNPGFDETIRNQEHERNEVLETIDLQDDIQVVDDSLPSDHQYVTIPDEGEYIGEVLNGKRHGQGRMNYNVGTVYEGTWANDRPNEQGILKFNRSHLYEGNFVNGKFHGWGRYQRKKDFYEGYWKNGKKHGEGIESVGGEIYRGNFRKGKKHGSGKFYSDIGTFEGIFKRNSVISGKFESKNNTWAYSGDWNKNKLEGEGTLELTSDTLLGTMVATGTFAGGQFKKGEINVNNDYILKGKVTFRGGEYYLQINSNNSN